MGRRGNCVQTVRESAHEGIAIPQSLSLLFWVALVGAQVIASAGCARPMTDDDYRAEVDSAIHDSIAADLLDLVKAARSLQAASPSRVWDPVVHASAISEMRSAWKAARVAYEHVEGAIRVAFPDLDETLDARYEDSLAELAAQGVHGDRDLFDSRGVIGMHAIERILFAPDIRSEVVDFERTLTGYSPAAYPSSDSDAISFKTVLVQRLIDDAESLLTQWQDATIDVGAAYRGLVDLMIEQQEKVNLAVTNEDESRYSNVTLFDLRNNLDGTVKIYNLFRDWVRSKPAGDHSDIAVQIKFGKLVVLYSSTSGDSLPMVPSGWRDGPSPDDLATPFGAMWQTVHESVDPASDSSVVSTMNRIATMLGFAEPSAP
jgi:iron uptake system component EfeO